MSEVFCICAPFHDVLCPNFPLPAPPSKCRTGCRTKDHASYAECLRDANMQIGNLK